MNERLIEVYSYTPEEMAVFPYLEKYMRKLPDLQTAEGRSQIDEKGFALAGLFLTYRAANHSGCEMTTSPERIQFGADSLHHVRLKELPSLTGIQFSGQTEYLSLIRMNLVKFLFMRPEWILPRLALKRKFWVRAWMSPNRSSAL